jgi:GxxExxY protein
MPIHVGAEIRRMGDEEFKARVYEVMRHVFDVQQELGRLFNEKIYHREIAFRVPDAQCEVGLDVQFEDFCKTYYLDLLVGGGAIFELKAVEGLAERHRRQLMHYLFLMDLPHGKLVNLRPGRVDHEFINNVLTRAERSEFTAIGDDWEEIEGARLKDRMVGLLRDWGTGLDLGLYEEAAAYLCGQPADAENDVEIRLGDQLLGVQRMRLTVPDVGLKVTAMSTEGQAEFQSHLERLLAHTELRAIQWINVARPVIRFKTIRKGKKGI